MNWDAATWFFGGMGITVFIWIIVCGSGLLGMCRGPGE